MTRSPSLRLLLIGVVLAVAVAGLTPLVDLPVVEAKSPIETITIPVDCTSGQVGTVVATDNCGITSWQALVLGGFEDPFFGCGRERYRGFLQFPLDSIPAGAKVTHADLSVFVVFPYLSTGPATIAVHPVLEAWGPYSPAFEWPGPAYGKRLDRQVLEAPGVYTWNVKKAVKGWVQGAPNHGFAFVAEDEDEVPDVFLSAPVCQDLPLPGFPAGWRPDPNQALLTVTYVVPGSKR